MELNPKYVGEICTATGIHQGLVTNLCRVYASRVNSRKVEADWIHLGGTSTDTILDFEDVKTRGVTIYRVFQVYQDIFDHLEMQISKSERKGMQWKVDIREGLVQAKLKAASYSCKTESPRGLLFVIGTCLNPYCKLNLFREWDLDASGKTEYEKSYKKEFIAYYDLY